MDIDNKLIVTIAIQMHGSIFTFDLSNETSNIFENVRLLCGAGGFKSYKTNFSEELVLVKNLKKQFALDMDESKSMFDKLQEMKNGMVIGNITFDKTLSIGSYLDGGFLDGVYLIAIHRGKKLIYPTSSNDTINLLNISDLTRLSSTFKSKMPNIEHLSSNFPNVKFYIDEENNINKNSKITVDEKKSQIEEIRRQLYDNINNWNLTLDYFKKNIEIIKLSVLVKIVKDIISPDCVINLLDYSCSNPSKIIPNEQNTLSKYATPYDIEHGIPNTKLGGKKKRIKSYKKKKRTLKKSYRNKKHK
jgi:hypothetical protein